MTEHDHLRDALQKQPAPRTGDDAPPAEPEPQPGQTSPPAPPDQDTDPLRQAVAQRTNQPEEQP